jgi:hypothetical protein
MIAAVAELRELATPPLEIARCDVIQHEDAVLEVAWLRPKRSRAA